MIFHDVTSSGSLGKGTDKIAMLQRDLANEKAAAYSVQAIPLNGATSQMFANKNHIIYKGPRPGDMVAKETRLLYPRMTQDHVLSSLDPVHRPFATVPYMGKGRKNVEREFSLMRGIRNPTEQEMAEMKERSIKEAGRHSFIPEGPLVRQVPMLPKEWVRGGEATTKRAPITGTPGAR